MRALLFTVLVSFNLVACVTGDNAEDMDMPTGEITAAQQDDMVDVNVADEEAQIRASRELPSTAKHVIDQGPSAQQQTAPAGGTQPAIEATLEKRPVRESQVPGTNGPALEQDAHVPSTNGTLQQDGQLPKIVEDTALETLSDEELEQLEQDNLHGKQIDANLPALR